MKTKINKGALKTALKDAKKFNISAFPRVARYMKCRFPGIKSERVTIAMIDQSKFDNIGNGNSLGMYFSETSSIVINKKVNTQKRYTIDEILIHEFIHHVSSRINKKRETIWEELFVLQHTIHYFLETKKYSINTVAYKFILPHILPYIKRDKDMAREEILKKAELLSRRLLIRYIDRKV